MKLNKFLIATLLAMCVIGFSIGSVSAKLSSISEIHIGSGFANHNIYSDSATYDLIITNGYNISSLEEFNDILNSYGDAIKDKPIVFAGILPVISQDCHIFIQSQDNQTSVDVKQGRAPSYEDIYSNNMSSNLFNTTLTAYAHTGVKPSIFPNDELEKVDFKIHDGKQIHMSIGWTYLPESDKPVYFSLHEHSIHDGYL